MIDSKNNHYFVGGKLYVIPKEIANIVDETESRLTKERDALRVENEKLKSLIRYTIEWCNDFNFDYMVRGLQDKLQKALNEVTK